MGDIVTGETEHPGAEILARYQQRQLPPAEILSVGDHLAACEACRQALADPARLASAVTATVAAVGEPEPPEFHLDDDHLAGYLDGTLSPVDRELAEGHL